MTDLPPDGAPDETRPFPVGPPTTPMPPVPPPTPLDLSSDSVVRRGRGGRVVAGIVGVALLGGGAVFAVTELTGSAGAGSPEGALGSMLDAVAEEDVLGVLEALAPAERDLLIDRTERLSGELSRLGVIPEDFQLDGVDGIDIEFADLEFEVETLRDDLATVEVVAGTVTTSVTADDLPIGPLLTDLADDLGEEIDVEDSTETTDIEADDAGLEITTVKVGGGWYVSIGYSIAESARADSGQPVPQPDDAVATNGGETPEDAVRNVFDAVADTDLADLIGTLPPDLYAPLYEYSSLFLDDAQDAIDQAVADAGVEIDVSSVDLSAETSGDTGHVTIDGLEITASADGETVEVGFADGCLSIHGAGVDEEVCEDDSADALADLPFGQDIVEQLSDVGASGLLVERVDGEWYVEPIGTVIDALVDVLAALDGDDIRDLVRDATSFFADFGTEFDTGLGDDLILDDEFLDDLDDGGELGFDLVDPLEELAPGLAAQDLAARLADAFGVDAATAECITEEFAFEVGFDETLVSSFFDALAFPDESPADEILDPYLRAAESCGL